MLSGRSTTSANPPKDIILGFQEMMYKKGYKYVAGKYFGDHQHYIDLFLVLQLTASFKILVRLLACRPFFFLGGGGGVLL